MKRNEYNPNWFVDRKNLTRFLKGKRVVFVGPAAYLQGEGRGEWIDEHDIVVRPNRSRPIPVDYGSRTDILFNFVTELWAGYFIGEKPFLKDGTKIVLTTTALPEYYRMFKAAMDIPAYLLAREDYGAIRKEIGSKPNTGTVAIAYLLSYPIASLDVVGMDLYASGYHAGYGGNLDPGSHNFDAQAIYLDTLQKDKRLRLDHAMLRRIEMAQEYREEPMEGVLPPMSIVIPYGKSDEYREQMMKWTVARYRRLFPDCEICIGENRDKPFNRAKAKNDGIRKATKELVLIVDADALFNRSLVFEALQIMRESEQRWVRAGGKSFRINEGSSRKLIQTSGPVEMVLRTDGLYSTNFFCIVERNLLDEIQGYDEGFKDWGGEDFAFYKALTVWDREGQRTRGKIWHIWHPVAEASVVHMKALHKKDYGHPTARRHLLYANATTKREIMKIREMKP